MEFTGSVVKIFPVEKIGQKETLKQTIVLQEQDKEYPNSIAVDFWGDRTDRSKGYVEGDTVKVKLNTKTREYNDKVYNNISVWSHDKIKQDNDGELPF